MKSLDEIKGEYCREIVLYFCREVWGSTQGPGPIQTGYPRKERFEYLLGLRLTSILLDTKLVRDFHINYIDEQAKRDGRIESLLQGGPNPRRDCEVILELSDYPLLVGPGRMMAIDFLADGARDSGG